jgi:hypothetical protein
MSKENMLSTHNGMLLRLIKEGNPALCTNPNKPGGNYVK